VNFLKIHCIYIYGIFMWNPFILLMNPTLKIAVLNNISVNMAATDITEGFWYSFIWLYTLKRWLSLMVVLFLNF
jgi:hypothetical protein